MSQFESLSSPEVPAEPQTSKLAITSLICSLIFCCPLTTIPGILMGLIATATTMGNPMKKGTGLAILAVIIGVVATAGQGWISVFTWKTSMKPLFDGPMPALAAGFDGDYAGMRSAMYGSAATATDEEIGAFITTLRDRYGEVQSVRFDAEQANSGFSVETEREFPYVVVFADASMNADVMMVFADELSGEPVGKPSTIVIRDADLGDIMFPGSSDGGDAESEEEEDGDGGSGAP